MRALWSIALTSAAISLWSGFACSEPQPLWGLTLAYPGAVITDLVGIRVGCDGTVGVLAELERRQTPKRNGDFRREYGVALVSQDGGLLGWIDYTTRHWDSGGRRGKSTLCAQALGPIMCTQTGAHVVDSYDYNKDNMVADDLHYFLFSVRALPLSGSERGTWGTGLPSEHGGSFVADLGPTTDCGALLFIRAERCPYNWPDDECVDSVTAGPGSYLAFLNYEGQLRSLWTVTPRRPPDAFCDLPDGSIVVAFSSSLCWLNADGVQRWETDLHAEGASVQEVLSIRLGAGDLIEVLYSAYVPAKDGGTSGRCDVHWAVIDSLGHVLVDWRLISTVEYWLREVVSLPHQGYVGLFRSEVTGLDCLMPIGLRSEGEWVLPIGAAWSTKGMDYEPGVGIVIARQVSSVGSDSARWLLECISTAPP